MFKESASVHWVDYRWLSKVSTDQTFRRKVSTHFSTSFSYFLHRGKVVISHWTTGLFVGIENTTIGKTFSYIWNHYQIKRLPLNCWLYLQQLLTATFTATPRPSPDISQSFDRVELGDLGKPRWRLNMAALFNYRTFTFQFIGLLYSGSKGRYFSLNKKTQFCVQTLVILMESIDHRTGSILTVIS